MPGICVFCGATASLTREHVFGDWLSKIGLDLEPVPHRGGALNRVGRDLGTQPPFRTTVKNVCGPCNGGWMSGLEDVAKRVLTPFILGQPGEIAAADARAIAAWAQKTALVAMLVSSEEERARGHGVPPAEYRELYALRDDKVPLPASHFWVGRYEYVRWPNVMASTCGLDDPGDRRRVEALMVEVLERLAVEGDTIAAQSEVIGQARQISVDRPCPVTEDLVTAYGLDADTLAETDDWTPIVGAELAGELPAYKLLHLATAKDTINQHLRGRRSGGRLSPDFDPRRVIDDMLSHSAGTGPSDGAEEDQARTEKAACSLFAGLTQDDLGDDGKVPTHLFPVAFLLGLTELRVRCRDLIIPALN
jgi:hypothetical protein